MLKSFIFDVDGTILDTEQAILKSLQIVLKEQINKSFKTNELRFALGIPGKDALTQLNIPDVESMEAKWSEAILEFSDEVTIFEGVEMTISQLSLQNIKLGIVTSKTGQEMIDEFEPFGLSDFFDKTVCASDTVHHKPHPEPLLNCLEQLNVSTDEAIYIGDSIYDFQCATAAGVKFALALWGAKTLKGFEGADYILKTPEDILNLLK